MNTTMKLAQSMAQNPFLSGSPFASSPFAPQAAVSAEVPEDAPEGSYTYALVKSAPEVPAAEVEVNAPAVEITIRWGNSVLHVAELSPPRSFTAGEDGCDFTLPAEQLGQTRAPLILVEGGAVFAVLLPGARGTVTVDGQRVSVAQAIASGKATPCADVAGAHRVAMPLGAEARVELGDLSIEVSTGNAGRQVAGKVRLDKRSLPFAALSLCAHLGLLGAMAALMPPMAMAEEGDVNADQRYALAQAFQAMAEREQDTSKDESESTTADVQGGTGTAAAGESGKMGSATAPARDGRYGQKGPQDNPEPMISKSALLSQAKDFGMIGLLQGGIADPNGVSAPWGSLDPSGRDPITAVGNMWGSSILESGGSGGLGLTGVGEMGGGSGLGVGLGNVGTIGNGAGLGDGQGFGPGRGGRLTQGHRVRSPQVRIANATVSGRLPAEVIQRIVRQNFGRFRACYESGLRTNPSLAGRVAVAFVIGRDGAVSSVQNAGSELQDSSVVSCVTRSFYGLAFPSPENGIVTVTYPIMFTPGS